MSLTTPNQRASSEIENTGILLESDRNLPNVVSLVVGRPVIGSWWGHPKGRVIWAVMNELISRPDIVPTKLVSGKVTLVAQVLWPDLVAVGASLEDWQTRGLSKKEMTLLRLVEEKGEITSIEAKDRLGSTTGKAVLELERKLLIESEQFHTSKGFHAKRLRSWKRWSRKVKLSPELPSASLAKENFERILGGLNRKYGGHGGLPWE